MMRNPKADDQAALAIAELEGLRLHNEAQAQDTAEGDPNCLDEYVHELINGPRQRHR